MNKYTLNCALKKNITDELLLKYSEVYNLEINDCKVLKYIVIMVVSQFLRLPH